MCVNEHARGAFCNPHTPHPHPKITQKPQQPQNTKHTYTNITQRRSATGSVRPLPFKIPPPKKKRQPPKTQPYNQPTPAHLFLHITRRSSATGSGASAAGPCTSSPPTTAPSPCPTTSLRAPSSSGYWTTRVSVFDGWLRWMVYN